MEEFIKEFSFRNTLETLDVYLDIKLWGGYD